MKKLILAALALGFFPLALFMFPVTVLNAVALIGNYHVTREIAYANGSRHSLDIYRPAHSDKPAPVVVFIYGGSWEQGDKKIYRFVGAALAASGFVAVIPDYRVYPEVRFPGFVEDAAKAVAWTREHAAAFGGDPDKIVLMGHSAGAHIASMLTFDPQWLAAVGMNPARDIRGFVGLAGPYDFLPLHSDTLKEIFGPPNTLAATQPINFVTSDAPPVFLGAAVDDTFVKLKNTINLAKRIEENGGHPEVKLYAGVSHLSLIGAFAAPLRWLAPVLYDTSEFIRKVTNSTPSAVSLASAPRKTA